jgi:hypothetical protein
LLKLSVSQTYDSQETNIKKVRLIAFCHKRSIIWSQLTVLAGNDYSPSKKLANFPSNRTCRCVKPAKKNANIRYHSKYWMLSAWYAYPPIGKVNTLVMYRNLHAVWCAGLINFGRERSKHAGSTLTGRRRSPIR